MNDQYYVNKARVQNISCHHSLHYNISIFLKNARGITLKKSTKNFVISFTWHPSVKWYYMRQCNDFHILRCSLFTVWFSFYIRVSFNTYYEFLWNLRAYCDGLHLCWFYYARMVKNHIRRDHLLWIDTFHTLDMSEWNVIDDKSKKFARG